MDLIRDLGVAGFAFFLIKGLIWLVIFGLVYFGLIDKEKARTIRKKLSFLKRKKNI
jgi:hypothetical protein